MDLPVEKLGRIGVLMGGVSSEREISLKSGQAIVEALGRRGCEVVGLDITDGEPEAIRSLLEKSGIDLAFIALHGRLGEDGTIQSILEDAGIPYAGSGVEASRLAINKALAQEMFKKNGIKIPSFVALSRKDPIDIPGAIEALGGFPVVVKPACEGSSIGVSFVRTSSELARAIEDAWQYGDTALIERYIKGKELTVGILGREALPVVEICPKRPFFDFEAKYTKGMTDYIVPARIPQDISDGIQKAALAAHRVLGCEDISRVDFILADDQSHYVLEINTIPGFTATSLLPKAAQHRGIGFDQLCYQLIVLAYGKKSKIQNITFRR
ncbi:MAG TPA: D-alanine--D-alanine ligase [Candidatus Omnitrophota bacterium]|nr:D-alanine--D-alanine ligase [Candidatus Omnitrophota bacterium]